LPPEKMPKPTPDDFLTIGENYRAHGRANPVDLLVLLRFVSFGSRLLGEYAKFSRITEERVVE